MERPEPDDSREGGPEPTHCDDSSRDTCLGFELAGFGPSY